jgi:Domain of unknown function (DUF4177)
MKNLSPQITSIPSFLAPSRRGVSLLGGCMAVMMFASRAEAKTVVWEYLVLNAGLQNRALETFLNNNGAQGWELVQISAKGVAIFKRRK